MTKILDGKKLAGEILVSLKKEIEKHSLKLRLAVILVGDNFSSQSFISQKERFAKFIGVDFKLFKFPAKISPLKLKEEIRKISQDPVNSGIVIQLPLPASIFRGKIAKKFSLEEFLNLIPEEKDVDLLSGKSLGKFCQGKSKVLPPTVSGFLKLLRAYQINLKGKNIVVIGGGRLVGLPLAIYLLKEKATFSLINEFTKDIFSFTKRADILVSAVGKPKLVNGKMVKKGAVIVDFGTNFQRGRLVGDIDFPSVSKKASFITPVPGGIGPMTVVSLLENLIKLNLENGYFSFSSTK